MSTSDVKSRCSIRGRIAFVLAIAEQCIGLLKYSETVYTLAANALADAWKWEEGGQVDGDQLDYYLENSDEESLAVYGCNPPESAWAAVMAITSAISYVIWHAYKKDGVTRMSESIHEVTEAVVDEVIDFAEKSPGFDLAYLDCVTKYIVEKCGSATPDDLGEPIARASILKACGKP